MENVVTILKGVNHFSIQHSFSCSGENADFWPLMHAVNLIPAGCQWRLNETKTIISKRNYNFMVLSWFLVVADMKCLYLSVLFVSATQSTTNWVALAILIGTYQLVNDIRARRGNACIRICSYTAELQDSSTSGTECRTVLVGSWVQLQDPASTGSRGVSCLSSLC